MRVNRSGNWVITDVAVVDDKYDEHIVIDLTGMERAPRREMQNPVHDPELQRFGSPLNH